MRCLNSDSSMPRDDLEEQLESSHKFKVFYHTLEFFGLCSQCQVNQATGTGQ